METLHFLNVGEGDCSVIEHASGRVTVIDVCNVAPVDSVAETLTETMASLDRGVGGNFRQKDHPVNPISYLARHEIRSVFRYIQTHPDMDHMDGIQALFNLVSPRNFWDTDNEAEKDFARSGPFRESDWHFYKELRDGKPQSSPKRLTLEPLSQGKFYNEPLGGDGLHVLVPTSALIAKANESNKYNEASYVILFTSSRGHRIVFGGDSHDETWKYILEQHEELATDVDLLVAPHHGRKSGRSYDFLDALNPTLTFFGNW